MAWRLAKFYAHELTLGQANLLFGVLALGGIAAIQMEAPAVSGVLFGLAVCIKPYAALFGPWLLVTEGRRATVAFASTCALALVAPVVVYGPGGNVQLLLDWWHTVTASTAPNLTGADNISFAALGAKWLGPGLTARLVDLDAALVRDLLGLANTGVHRTLLIQGNGQAHDPARLPLPAVNIAGVVALGQRAEGRATEDIRRLRLHL